MSEEKDLLAVLEKKRQHVHTDLPAGEWLVGASATQPSVPALYVRACSVLQSMTKVSVQFIP